MDIQWMKDVLFWCMIFNMFVLFLWFFVFVFARDWFYRIHGRYFDIPQEAFGMLHYCGMGLYKMGILFFNIVPFLVFWLLRPS